MNTLRGVFPPPKPTYKRNFIQENMKHIKHMQGIYNKVEVVKPTLKSPSDKYQNIPSRITKYMLPTKSKTNTTENPLPSKVKSLPNTNNALRKSKNQICITESTPNSTMATSTIDSKVEVNKYRDMGVQTDNLTFALKESRNTVRISKRLPSTKRDSQQEFNKNMSCGDGGMILKNVDDNTEKLNYLKIDEKSRKVDTKPSTERAVNYLGKSKSGKFRKKTKVC